MITFIFTSLLSLIFVFFSFQIIKRRRKFSVPLGDNNILELRRWISAQNNFVQYSLFFIMLLFFLEVAGNNKIEIIILGSLFFVSRIIHACSLVFIEKYENNQLTAIPKVRVLAMMITFFTIIYCAAKLLILSFLNF